MVWSFTYIQIKYKRNKSLVRCIDRSMIRKVHVITERPNLITFVSDLMFVWSLNNKWIIYSITKLTNKLVSQSLYNYSEVDTLFVGDWRFCQSLRLIICWRLGKRWTGCCWEYGPTFQGELKRWLLKRLKNSVLQFLYKIERMYEITRKNKLS